MDRSRTQYAETADGAHIAYQLFGVGPAEVVLIGEWMSNVEATFEARLNAEALERLGRFARVLLFDKRGVGLSDHVPIDRPPELEHWADDVLAVLDAAGWERASLLAAGAGTALSVVFAATYPDSTASLVLINPFARYTRAPDYAWGAPEHAPEALRRAFLELWGTGTLTLAASPGEYDEATVAEVARIERLMASPGTAAALVPMQYQSDVRSILPLVQAPALVIHRRDNAYVRVGNGRYVAEHLPNARYLEIAGNQHNWNFGFEEYAADIEEFLTGHRSHIPTERMLATLLFVDIVESTTRTAEIGDEQWQRTLDAFDALVQRQLRRFRGRVVNTRGDDYLAMFDGPARAVACAQAIRDGVRGLGLEVRAGLHTGEVVPHGLDVTGLAVDLAARVCGLAGPSEILVSRTIVDLVVGSGISFDDAGSHLLKGIPERWQLFRVVEMQL